MNQQQQFAIDYLREENRVLKEQLGGRGLRLNDDQRRRLAAKAKRLTRLVLAEVARMVTPETLLAAARRFSAASGRSFVRSPSERPSHIPTSPIGSAPPDLSPSGLR